MTHYTLPTITLVTEPSGTTQTLPRPKTVQRLLRDLNIRPTTVLVIRDGELLTHDRAILPNDTITVRTVVSSG